MSGFTIHTEKYSINVRTNTFLVAVFCIDPATLSAITETKWWLTEVKYTYLLCNTIDLTFQQHTMKHTVKIVISGLLS